METCYSFRLRKIPFLSVFSLPLLFSLTNWHKSNRTIQIALKINELYKSSKKFLILYPECEAFNI